MRACQWYAKGRIDVMKKLWIAALIPLLTLLSLSLLAEVPKLPDLDVTYISQRPLWHGYWFDYPNDVPTFWVPDQNAPDGKRTVTKEEFIRLTKCKPAAGDKVTFTAHVRNNGYEPSPATTYCLYIDDKVVAKGKIKPLQPDEEQAIPYQWTYQDGEHAISCEVDPQDRIKEICETNNRLSDPTWGIGLTIRTFDQVNYKAFRSAPNLWGSYSFEDWCQAHIQEWRKAFREAIYPATPEGILQGIRFDGIFTSAEDPAMTELRQATKDSITRFGRDLAKIKPQDMESLEKDGCNWRINWRLEDIPNYAKAIDRGLIHELCHQCGIIDLYQFGLNLPSVLVTDPNGHFLWNAEGCYHQFGDLMAVYGVNIENPLQQHGLFLEHTAAAFNSEIGKPRWGFGLMMFDVPKQNVLRILDNQGDPIPNASVKLWQQQIETRLVGRIPPKVGTTDSSGEWDLGAHPIDKIHVVGTNGIMLIGIEAYGQWEFHTLVISEMNIAYWRGAKDRHVYAMRTGIAPPGSIPPPTNLRLEALSAKKVRLTWDYPETERSLHKFLVMKRTGAIEAVYEPAFAAIVTEVWSDKRSVEVEAVAAPRDLFVVVAVDQMGNPSGYSNIVVYPADDLIPDLGRVFGVAQTPDGSIYVLNTDGAAIFGLTPKGGRVNMGDKIRLDGPEIVCHMASDSRGILYIPNPGGTLPGDGERTAAGGYIYRVDPAREERLDDLRSEGLTKPRGIAVDGKDNLYVTDLADKKVHVITKEGKLLATIGDADTFSFPRAVYVDRKGTVYVVDCQIDPAKYRESPATVYVFRKKSGDGWDYEQALKIQGLFAIDCVIADEEGRIYAGGSGGIHVFDKDGKKLAQWTQKPYGTPMGAELVGDMAWDKDGSLLVTQGFTIRQLIRVTRDEILSSKPS
jgi:hypothetical protein